VDLGAALLGLVTGGVIKLTVMVLGARLLLRLYRTRVAHPPRRPWLLVPAAERPHLRWLTAGLILFFASELTCGIEVYILARSSPIVSCAHGLLSAAAMATTAIGLFELVDRRLLHWRDTSRRCAALPLCTVCSKRTTGRCRFRALSLVGATLLAFSMVPVLAVPTATMPADPRPWALPFDSWNAWYDGSLQPWLQRHFPWTDLSGAAFHVPHAMLVLEMRLLPLLAVALAAAAALLLLRGRENLGAVLLLGAAGVAAYSLFEAVIYGLTGDPFLAALLHEGGELLFLVGLAELLLRLFEPAPIPAA
jgi:hypothetical protein